MLGNDSLSRFAVAVLVARVVFGTVPATVAAQSDARTGGTIVVEEGETVDSLEAFGGSVVVQGTVTGDVSAVGGDVRIEETGQVNGDLEAAAGSVTIAGTVDGDVEVGAGSFTVTESGPSAAPSWPGSGARRSTARSRATPKSVPRRSGWARVPQSRAICATTETSRGTPMLSRARFERTPRSGSMLRRRFSRSRRGCSPPMPSR